jgi:hypothetical protein
MPKDFQFSLTVHDLHVDGFKAAVSWVDAAWNDGWLAVFRKNILPPSSEVGGKYYLDCQGRSL